jgi:hypothetical protein
MSLNLNLGHQAKLSKARPKAAARSQQCERKKCKKREEEDPQLERKMEYVSCGHGRTCVIHGHYHKVKGKNMDQAQRRLKEKRGRNVCRVKYCLRDPEHHEECAEHAHDKRQTLDSADTKKRLISKMSGTAVSKESKKKGAPSAPPASPVVQVGSADKANEDVLAMGFSDAEHKHDARAASEEQSGGENSADDSDNSEITSCDDPDTSGDEVTSSEEDDSSSEEEDSESDDSTSDDSSGEEDDDSSSDDEDEDAEEMAMGPRLLYEKGSIYDQTFLTRAMHWLAEQTPGVKCRKLFQLNERDVSLLSEDQRNRMFGQHTYTFLGVHLYSSCDSGDTVLLEEVYDSVRIGQVYTQVTADILACPELVTRTAISADGKPTTGFAPKVQQIMTQRADYRALVANADVYANTLTHIYNQFILRGLVQQRSQPKTSSLSFRISGRSGAPPPIGRLSESGSNTVTLKKSLFMMKVIVSCTAASFLLMEVYYFRTRDRSPMNASSTSTTVPIEPSSAHPSRTLGEYMGTRIGIWRSRFGVLLLPVVTTFNIIAPSTKHKANSW